jgi:hypothetical protein
MDELVSEVNAALRQGDWSAVVMTGSSLYGIAAACGEWMLAERIRDVVEMALFVLEHPGFGPVSMPLAVAVSQRLQS